MNDEILPDEMDVVADAIREQKPTSRIPQHVRDYASQELEQASALISDLTPECEDWNLSAASASIRNALKALAFNGGRK